jgi:hypothetical protein
VRDAGRDGWPHHELSRAPQRYERLDARVKAGLFQDQPDDQGREQPQPHTVQRLVATVEKSVRLFARLQFYVNYRIIIYIEFRSLRETNEKKTLRGVFFSGKVNAAIMPAFAASGSVAKEALTARRSTS